MRYLTTVIFTFCFFSVEIVLKKNKLSSIIFCQTEKNSKQFLKTDECPGSELLLQQLNPPLTVNCTTASINRWAAKCREVEQTMVSNKFTEKLFGAKKLKIRNFSNKRNSGLQNGVTGSFQKKPKTHTDYKL